MVNNIFKTQKYKLLSLWQCAVFSFLFIFILPNVFIAPVFAGTTASASATVIGGTVPSSGGGGSAISYAPPIPPAEGFYVSINNGNEKTDSRIVDLILNGGQDTARMAISNFSDFRWAIQEPYQKMKKWTLAENEGDKIVYAKFFNQYGQSSGVVSDSIIYAFPSTRLTPEAQKTDSNRDGVIDIFDLNNLLVNWGAKEENNSADFDGNGIVDIFDFNLLMIYWTL